MAFTAQTPTPTLAWQFESSNVDYVTGLSPNESTPGTYTVQGGGTVQTVAGKRVHTFSTGTITGVTYITFFVPVTAEVLVVAGGGGGGGTGSNNQTGGGGGGGELYYNASYSIAAGTYSIQVGEGGDGGTGSGVSGGTPTDGTDSIFGSITCNGGGCGGANNGSGNGASGGSGGGASRGGTGGASVKTASGFGNAGGSSAGSLAGGTAGGGAGGGAGGVGAAAGPNNDTRAAGGAGKSYSISGSSVSYANGGDGGSRGGTSNGATGASGTGNGGGGGDGNATTNGGSGGSGIIIISYYASLTAPTYVTGKYGQAISFDNQNANTTVSNSYTTYTLADGTSNSYSLSCWIRPLHAFPTTTLNPNYVVLRDSGGYYSLQTIAASSTSGFYANEGVSGGQGTTFSGLLTTGTWGHHCFVLSNVGATSSNTIVTYYFNGASQASGNVRRTNGFSIFSALDLGYRSGVGNSGAWCSIDDVRLYNTALTATQVQLLYQSQGMSNNGNYSSSSPYGLGGTVTTSGGNRIHTYTAVGSSTFTCTQPGYVQLLVVAGGGGGGGNNTSASAGGGGGAGEVFYSAAYLIVPGTYTVTVGAGGSAGALRNEGAGQNGTDGGDGGASVFGSLSANGGGGGSTGALGNNGRSGGSGGGCGRTNPGSGGASVKTAGGLGNKGGDNADFNLYGAGGGGGAGGVAQDAYVSGSTAIPGGTGYSSSISGASVTYGTGGSGGSRSGTYTPGAGTANRGDGGDGAPVGGTAGSNGKNGGAGGSGIVIVAYRDITPGTYTSYAYKSPGFAQWATRLAGTGTEDSGTSITSDSSGNIYVTGYYTSNPLTIYNSDGSSSGITLPNSGYDVFIVKYNTNGTAQWATRLGGTSNEIVNSIAVDSSGNIYVTGFYDSNPLTIYNSDGGTFGTLTNSGFYDVFIVKYNTNGTAQWATRLAGTGYDYGYSIAVDSSGNIYVTGSYNDTSNPLTIYNSDGSSSGITLTTSGVVHVFIVKYNTNGFAQWATRLAGTGFDDGYSIAVDSSGNIYVTGSYDSNPLTIYNSDGGTFGTLTNSGVSGSTDVFIVKYNTNGFAQWATKLAGIGTEYGYSIASDSSGNLYVTGRYDANPLTIYNSDGSSSGITLTNSVIADVFIVKYNTNGFAQWATRLAGIGTGFEYGYSIAVDSSGNIYVTGSYYNTSNPLAIYNSDGGTFGTLTNSGGYDVFIVKYNTNGTAQWATRLAGTGYYDDGYSIAVDSSGNIYVTGRYKSNPLTIYNNGGETFGTLTNSGGSDVFIVKFKA